MYTKHSQNTPYLAITGELWGIFSFLCRSSESAEFPAVYGLWPDDAYICASDLVLLHYSDIIMIAMTSQITGVSIVVLPFVQAQINENIKAPRHWPLWGNPPGEVMAFHLFEAKPLPEPMLK